MIFLIPESRADLIFSKRLSISPVLSGITTETVEFLVILSFTLSIFFELMLKTISIPASIASFIKSGSSVSMLSGISVTDLAVSTAVLTFPIDVSNEIPRSIISAPLSAK